jgi:hypothetical protein
LPTFWSSSSRMLRPWSKNDSDREVSSEFVAQIAAMH